MYSLCVIMWLTHRQQAQRGEGGGGVVLWLSAAVKLCERWLQTLITSYADHMFTGINLGLESGFGIYLLCVRGLCYLSWYLTIGT